jgi:ubiquinone/menaquinone biosynthesis C-methylase UbiE
MTQQTPWHDEWVRVDQSSDPAWFIRYLDAARVRHLEQIRQDPRQYFSYLDLHEGQAVLDVGCGVGTLLHGLAQLVGPAGRVVGVDASAVMIAEARKRAEGLGLPLEFQQGDVYALDVPADTFDRCNAANLFVHLRDPLRGLSELIRVTRPGGRVAILEVDWETQIVDVGTRAVTRKILNGYCDGYAHGWIGRQLPAMFMEAQLTSITIRPMTVMLGPEQWRDPAMGLLMSVDRAQEAGTITTDERLAWLEDFERRAQSGRFFAAFTYFRVVGTKPERSPA